MYFNGQYNMKIPLIINIFPDLLLVSNLVISCLAIFYFALKRKNKFLLVAFPLIGIYLPFFHSVFNSSGGLKLLEKIGIFISVIALSLLLLNFFQYVNKKSIYAWIFPTSITLISIGISFLFTEYRLLDFIFWIGLGLGIALLISGVYWKLFGLVIPGCLLIGSISGVYFGWVDSTGKNALMQTGIMLVWIALGWGLVTIFARVQTFKFVWWPLIPGGIIAMVGWGLYIGGNPRSAVGFIGNTGSIGLLIFGIYILLLRRGIHH